VDTDGFAFLTWRRVGCNGPSPVDPEPQQHGLRARSRSAVASPPTRCAGRWSSLA